MDTSDKIKKIGIFKLIQVSKSFLVSWWSLPMHFRALVLVGLAFVVFHLTAGCSSISEHYLKAIEDATLLIESEMDDLLQKDPLYKELSAEFLTANPNYIKESIENRKAPIRTIKRSIKAARGENDGN